jgi:hypothetical protein
MAWSGTALRLLYQFIFFIFLTVYPCFAFKKCAGSYKLTFTAGLLLTATTLRRLTRESHDMNS